MGQRSDENLRNLRHDAMMKVVARDDRGLRDVIASHGLDCDFIVRGRHVLSVACASSSVGVVRELLAGGAPVSGSSTPGRCPKRDDPLLVTIRLNREDVFEELLKKVRKVTCVVPWTCLTERRYAMLDNLLQGGFCPDFLELMASEFWGVPQCRFMRRYLPVLVVSNVFLDKWEIATQPRPPPTAKLPLSAVPLLLTARARLPKDRISSVENDAASSFLHSPQTLQDVARSVIRTCLVKRQMYKKLANIFFPVRDRDLDAEIFLDDEGQRALQDTVIKFNSLPSYLLEVLFLVKEKREFMESLDIDHDQPSIWISLVVDK